MNIIVSNNTDKPIYQQIYEQLSSQIIKGELPADTCLPPIRTVAKELRISVITVKKAWEELEHGGFIYTMAGRGCFVASLARKELDVKRDALVKEKLERDSAYYKAFGRSLEELLDLIRRYYEGDR